MIKDGETVKCDIEAYRQGYRCPHCRKGVAVAKTTDGFTCPECGRQWFVGFELKVFEFLV